MSMAVGGAKGGVQHDINVTPLIDVVLVLLIIFMVLTPMMQKAHQINLPAPPDTTVQQPPPDPANPQLIISMEKDKTLSLNQEAVKLPDLQKRLREVLGERSTKIVFFKCDASVKYADAMNVMDVMRGAGVEKIGIITEELKKAAEGGADAAPEGEAPLVDASGAPVVP